MSGAQTQRYRAMECSHGNLARRCPVCEAIEDAAAGWVAAWDAEWRCQEARRAIHLGVMSRAASDLYDSLLFEVRAEHAEQASWPDGCATALAEDEERRRAIKA